MSDKLDHQSNLEQIFRFKIHAIDFFKTNPTLLQYLSLSFLPIPSSLRIPTAVFSEIIGPQAYTHACVRVRFYLQIQTHTPEQFWHGWKARWVCTKRTYTHTHAHIKIYKSTCIQDQKLAVVINHRMPTAASAVLPPTFSTKRTCKYATTHTPSELISHVSVVYMGRCPCIGFSFKYIRSPLVQIKSQMGRYIR